VYLTLVVVGHYVLVLTHNTVVAEGKSTLLKLITGEIEPKTATYYAKGEIWRHPSLRIGCVSQNAIETLEAYAGMTIVEYANTNLRAGTSAAAVIKKASGNVRQYLGAFGLGGEHAHRAIGSLSGGERMRLCFATVLAEEPHLLVLDEPTNHLDIETLDALSHGLDLYKGSVVIVSHNQNFLSGFCQDLWIVEDGKVDVRRHESESFDAIFMEYRREALVGSADRARNKQSKAGLARKATLQRAGTVHGAGFIHN